MADLEIKGKTLTAVTQLDNSEVLFAMADGAWRMWHSQDCCESVYIESVVGDWDDLVGHPLLIAEEVSSGLGLLPELTDDSFTWTFYKFATVKGSVTVRWLGTSNGYYSESVSFEKIGD